MNSGTWTVKTCTGRDWGIIKKIVIDASNREISFVDVLIDETQQIVRLPWSSLDIRHEGFYLKHSEPTIVNPAHAISSSVVAVDIPAQIPGRVRPAPPRAGWARPSAGSA